MFVNNILAASVYVCEQEMQHPFTVAVLAGRVSAPQLPPALREAAVFRQIISLVGRNLAQTRNFLLRLRSERYAHPYLVLLDHCSDNADVALILAQAARWHLSVVLYGAELCHATGLPASLASVGIAAFYDAHILQVDAARVRIAPPPEATDADTQLVADACRVLELAGGEADTHDLDTVKRAYRRLALKYHPDKHMQAGSEERQAMSNAFHTLETTYSALFTLRRWSTTATATNQQHP